MSMDGDVMLCDGSNGYVSIAELESELDDVERGIYRYIYIYVHTYTYIHT